MVKRHPSVRDEACPPAVATSLISYRWPPYGIKEAKLQARLRAAYRPMAILREWIQKTMRERRGPDGHGAPVSSAASKGYPIFPLRTLTELDRLIRRVRTRLDVVTAPTVILQAKEDDMTSPRNATLVYEGIASKEKRLVLFDDCYHVLTVDKQKHLVVDALTDFLTPHVARWTLRLQSAHEKRQQGMDQHLATKWP